MVSFILIGLTVLFLGQAAAQDSLSGSIEVWAWPGADGPLKALLPSFNEKYPDIEVNITTLGFEDVHTKLLAALSSGVGAPDVSGLADARVIKFGSTGGLTDLSERFAPFADTIMPFKRSFVTGPDGEVWGVPWDAGPTAVFYNRDIFDEYGVSPDDITTWDGYIEAGKKILEASGGDVFMLPARPEQARFLWEMIALEQGAGIFKDDLSLNLDSDAFKTACDVTKRIFEAGIAGDVPIFEQAWIDGFNNGTWASVPQAVWVGGILRSGAPDQAGRFAVTRWPSITEGGSYAVQGFDFGSALVIPSGSNNKDLAWAFVEYAELTPEGQLIQYTQGDLFPSMVTPDVLDAPVFSAPDAYFGDQPVREVFADSNAKFDVSIRVHPDYAEAQNILERNLAPAFEGQATCDEALEAAAREITNKLRLN